MTNTAQPGDRARRFQFSVTPIPPEPDEQTAPEVYPLAATATAAVAAVANSRYLIPPLDQIDEEFDITIYLYGADGLRQQLIARLLADELSRSKEPEQVIAFIIDMAAQMMSPPAPPTSSSLEN